MSAAGLSALYYNPRKSGSYGGAGSLVRAARSRGVSGASRGRVVEWLSGQAAYTLHKPARVRFKRNRTLVSEMDWQWQADLVDMREHREFNDGFCYILMCIDMLSKYAWAVPLKTKTGGAVTGAFRNILQEGRAPKKLQTDEGKEFLNRTFQNFLKRENIEHFVTASDVKASVVERFNRTIKTKMWRYLTHKNTFRYIDVLSDLIYAYNHSYHTTIKRTPASVTSDNSLEVWRTVYDEHFKRKPSKFSFNVGDRVRVSKIKGVFEKGYEQTFTDEIFIVKERTAALRPYYKLQDYAGDDIKASFYAEELQKINPTAESVYRIQTILAARDHTSALGAAAFRHLDLRTRGRCAPYTSAPVMPRLTSCVPGVLMLTAWACVAADPALGSGSLKCGRGVDCTRVLSVRAGDPGLCKSKPLHCCSLQLTPLGTVVVSRWAERPPHQIGGGLFRTKSRRSRFDAIRSCKNVLNEIQGALAASSHLCYKSRESESPVTKSSSAKTPRGNPDQGVMSRDQLSGAPAAVRCGGVELQGRFSAGLASHFLLSRWLISLIKEENHQRAPRLSLSLSLPPSSLSLLSRSSVCLSLSRPTSAFSDSFGPGATRSGQVWLLLNALPLHRTGDSTSGARHWQISCTFSSLDATQRHLRPLLFHYDRSCTKLKMDLLTDGSIREEVILTDPSVSRSSSVHYCVLMHRANITCYWEPGEEPHLNTTYTLNVDEIHCRAAQGLGVSAVLSSSAQARLVALAVGTALARGQCDSVFEKGLREQCTPPAGQWHCTVSGGEMHNYYIVTVTARDARGSATSPRLCLWNESVKLYPPVLRQLTPVPGQARCLRLLWALLPPVTSRQPNLSPPPLQRRAWQADLGPQTSSSATLCLFSPFTRYSVQLRTRYHGSSRHWSEWSSALETQTEEAAPAVGPQLWRREGAVSADGRRWMTLQWKPLLQSQANGKILGYNVTCCREGAPQGQEQQECGVLPPQRTSCVLVLPAPRCSCSLSAFNAAGHSPPARITLPDAGERGRGALDPWISWGIRSAHKGLMSCKPVPCLCDLGPLLQSQANGKILGYNVTCCREGAPQGQEQQECGVLPPQRTSCVLVLPAPRCSCSLSAFNAAGHSPPARITLPDAGERVLPPPMALTVTPLDDSSLSVRWTPLLSQSVTSFVVEWCPVSEVTPCVPHWLRLAGNVTETVITEAVEAGVRYNVSVRALRHGQGGAALSLPAYSRQRAPSAGPRLHVVDTWIGGVALQWDPIPIHLRHGFIRNYTVCYCGADNRTQREYRCPAAHVCVSVCVGLVGAYRIHVMASTDAGSAVGEAVTVVIALTPCRCLSVSEDGMSPVMTTSLYCVALLLLAWPDALCVSSRIKKQLWPVVPDPANSSLASWTPKKLLKVRGGLSGLEGCSELLI
ncbi:IL6RB protein, partial [Atractosteus spatula]|nr:IL6RB protein [Atractosteus spatula]